VNDDGLPLPVCFELNQIGEQRKEGGCCRVA
jgi:hypothetical protein